MTDTLLMAIRRLLHDKPFRELHHAPTKTSEDSARVRGDPLAIGGKALVMKVDGEFALFVISAASRLDSAALRTVLRIRRLGFATTDELRNRTGLVSGDVPPFGPPILPFPLHADESIFENERIAFNAGSLTDSIIMTVTDSADVAQPRRLRFSTPSTS